MCQLKCNYTEVHEDLKYKQNGTPKMAKTRIQVCRVSFKQNIGHLGKDVVVAGVHGHFYTMKIKWPEQWSDFWDRLVELVKRLGIHFLAGDFNMSLTEVPKQLRSRGITCDCVAWYPWKGDGAQTCNNAEISALSRGQPLGFDSCGIFYIGGRVEVITDWICNRSTSSPQSRVTESRVASRENVPVAP